MVPTPLENQLTTQISNLRQDDFQSFVTDLLLTIHGISGFQTIRRTKDQGADGIIISERCIVACWGPEKIVPSKMKAPFEKKARADFNSYKANWEAKHPKWRFYTNHDPSPDQIKFIDDLKAGSPIIGTESLVYTVANEVTSAQKRRICEKLKISKEYISLDAIASLLEDILATSSAGSVMKYQKPEYTPEKITINFSHDEFDSISNEFDYLQEKYSVSIGDALHSFNDSEISRIKYSVVSDYNMSGGNCFSDRFRNQSEKYIYKYNAEGDTEKIEIIRSLQFYIFEQCLIGQRTNGGF